MPDPILSNSESELRAHVGRALNEQYDLDREIGRGGMGIVYRARDRRLKRIVAIKLLPPELGFRSEIRSRFLREAETAAQLSHPNIVPIYSVGEAENLVYFVMAYVDGDNLAKRLNDRGRMSPEDTRRILGEVAGALAYAHARNVVHRDIKPDNILLDAETGRALVTDFGIARAVSEGADSRLTATGMAIGTPAYMSPEQCAGEREIDGRTDLYSLGIVGYQMLVGELPFTANNTPAMLVKHISEPAPPIELRRPDIPTDLGRAIMMMLEKDPAHRFPNAMSLVTALETRHTPERTGPPPAPRATGAVARQAPSSQPATLADDATYLPAADEVKRWNTPMVHDFRKKVRFFGALAPVLLLVGIFSDGPFLFFAVMWTLYIAFKYAKLWSEGFDWRDVFRQPRDRLLIEVASETIDEMQGLLDKDRRQEIKARARRRRLSGGMPRLPGGTDGRTIGGSIDLSAQAGAYAGKVQQAALDRDAIVQLVESMPKNEREMVSGVATSAIALHERIQSLALSLADLERNLAPGAADAVHVEIARLESEANPLDTRASEERVRRLAFLKRQRRSLGDLVNKQKSMSERLEGCALALQNMRFDILRLRAGAQSHQRVTTLAQEAMALAKEIDLVVSAGDEVGRLTARRSAPGPM